MFTTFKKRTVLMLALLLALTLYLQGEPVAADSDGQLVVKVAPSGDITTLNAAYGTETIRPLLSSSGIYLLQAAPGASLDALIDQMQGDPNILAAESNIVGSAPEANSRDTYAWPEGTTTAELRTEYGWEYGGRDAAHYENQPINHKLSLASARQISSGHGTTVAILDTGIDLTHPLLAPALSGVTYDFIDDDPTPTDVGNNLDDDGDGAIDEAFGHGTHIAGIVHLVAPDASLLPLRVLDADGQGHAIVIAEAIRYAVDQGADVINLSLGTSIPSPTLQAAVEEATAAGVLVVAAAGNLSTDIPQYPAAYACALGVTAVDNSTLHKADYANYGAWIGVAAPGERIYSTYPAGSFAWWNGTSMAAPFASAQAALLLAQQTALSPSALAAHIAATARPLDQQNPDYAGLLGAGRIAPLHSLQTPAAAPTAAATTPFVHCSP